MRLKLENASVTATLTQERGRIQILEDKIIRYESSVDQMNRKMRDKDDLINQLEQELNDKQHRIEKTQHEKEKQRRKYDSKLAEEADKKKREMEIKLSEQERKMKNQMRTQEEKLRLVTDIINGNDIRTEPVSNLINRFNANCENNAPLNVPTSERKARPKVNHF
jgi:kinesin family protein 23